MDFELGFAGQGGAGGIPRRQDGAPFRLLLVGDFSGRDGAAAGQPRAPLRRPLAIDSGDVDLALERLEVSLPVQVPGAGAETVRFASLEDFHPDALFGRLAAFEVPRQLRAALAAPSPSPETFTAVEAWLQGLTGTLEIQRGDGHVRRDVHFARVEGGHPVPAPPGTSLAIRGLPASNAEGGAPP